MKDLFDYPLMSALIERRTRRIPRGLSVNAGPLSHESNNQPAPLSKLEEAILITCITGITGVTTHDGPLTKANGYRRVGHAVPARHGAHGQQRRQLPGHALLHDQRRRHLPAQAPDRERRRSSRFSALPPQVGRLDRERLDAPPSVQGARLRQAAQLPARVAVLPRLERAGVERAGTTMFYPLVDCTWQYINALLILAAEPDGKRPLFIDDWRPFKPKGAFEWMAKIGGTRRPRPRRSRTIRSAA